MCLSPSLKRQLWEGLTLNKSERQKTEVLLRRQRALFGLGVSLLFLWTFPHPHGGEYVFGDARVSGSALDFWRFLATAWGWGAVIQYLFTPWWVLRKWVEWYPDTEPGH